MRTRRRGNGLGLWFWWLLGWAAAAAGFPSPQPAVGPEPDLREAGEIVPGSVLRRGGAQGAADPSMWRGTLRFDHLQAGPWRVKGLAISWRQLWDLPLGEAGAIGGRIDAEIDRLWGLGVEIRELRLAGVGSMGGMELEGSGLFGGKRFGLRGGLAGPDRKGEPWRAQLRLTGLELEALTLPASWTAGLGSVEVNGRIAGETRLHWRPGGGWQGELVGTVRLERVVVQDSGLELKEVQLRPVVRWGGGPGIFVPPVEMRVGSLKVGVTLIEDIRLRLAWDGRFVRGELLGARFAGGRVWSEPFAWQPAGGVLTVRLRLAEVELGQLTTLIPRFRGRAEGRVGGELPVVVYPDGRVRIQTGRLALEADAPAALEYDAEGLFTANVPPDSPRYRQMRLVERALRRLRLEVLEVVVNDTRQSDLLLQVQLRGVSETPELIVPVDFRLNVRGDLEELLRLFGRGDMEFSFD